MTDPSHLDDDLPADVRLADRFANFTDAELSAWIAREGSPSAAATMRRLLNAAGRLERLSPTREKPEHQFADAYLMEVCVNAAERIQAAMPVHRVPQEPERSDLAAGWIILLWVGSLFAGWFGQPVWLAVPPLVILLALVQGHRQQFARFPFNDPKLRQRQAAKFYSTMIAPTLMATAWSAILNGLLFGAAYLARSMTVPLH